MDNLQEKILREKIEAAGYVTAAIKEKFFYGVGFEEIRNRLEEMGFNRHLPIELCSTEIAIITPFGVMMQIRPTDHNQLGMWGGVLNDGEEPIKGAIRELEEETGIQVDECQLEFVEVNEHDHTYANGDQARFKSWRYVVKFNFVPEITTDEESVGAYMVVHTILNHQQGFIKRLLGEK